MPGRFVRRGVRGDDQMGFYHQLRILFVFAGGEGYEGDFLKIVVLVHAAGDKADERGTVQDVQEFVHIGGVVDLAGDAFFGCLFEDGGVEVFHVVQQQQFLIVEIMQMDGGPGSQRIPPVHDQVHRFLVEQMQGGQGGWDWRPHESDIRLLVE